MLLAHLTATTKKWKNNSRHGRLLATSGTHHGQGAEVAHDWALESTLRKGQARTPLASLLYDVESRVLPKP